MNSCVKMSYVAAQGLVEQILQYGRIVRPVLGITIAPPQVLHLHSPMVVSRLFVSGAL